MSPPRNRPGPRTLEAIRMPKLLVDQEWYEPTQPHAVVDTAYESLLVTRAGVLYPGFATVPFRLRISNDRGMSSPHLALVDTAYRGWWLVLLETGPAPTADYVTKQAEVLRAERYGRDVARLLAQRNTVLEAEPLEHMLSREMPGVFVLLAHPPAPAIEEPEVRIGIAEIFRSASGVDILRINGAQPTPPEETVGTCTRDAQVAPSLLRLTLAPGANMTFPPTCDIEVSGSHSVWGVRPHGSNFWLVPESSVTLPVHCHSFRLVRSESGRLRLIPHAR